MAFLAEKVSSGIFKLCCVSFNFYIRKKMDYKIQYLGPVTIRQLNGFPIRGCILIYEKQYNSDGLHGYVCRTMLF